MLPLLYFGIFSLFSAKPLYEQWLLTFWNLFFTSLPVLCFGIFEQVWRIWAGEEVCIFDLGGVSCPFNLHPFVVCP
jgi:magnesium-transporting ATPase (P-type)